MRYLGQVLSRRSPPALRDGGIPRFPYQGLSVTVGLVTRPAPSHADPNRSTGRSSAPSRRTMSSEPAIEQHQASEVSNLQAELQGHAAEVAQAMTFRVRCTLVPDGLESIPPGSKHVHFIRHGEGHHNVVQREWRAKPDWDGGRRRRHSLTRSRTHTHTQSRSLADRPGSRRSQYPSLTPSTRTQSSSTSTRSSRRRAEGRRRRFRSAQPVSAQSCSSSHRCAERRRPA